MGGCEDDSPRTFFDSYEDGRLKREAERVGFIVVCPKGRDSASMYRGAAEQDVLDAMADVQRDYRNRFRADLSDGPLDGRVRHVEHRHGTPRPLCRARSDLRRRIYGGHGEDPPDPGVCSPWR